MKRFGFTAASGIFSILGRVPHSDAGNVILPACSPHVDGPAPPQADVRPDRTRTLAISTRKACAGNRVFRPMPCLRHEDHYDSVDRDARQSSCGVLPVRSVHHTFLFHQLRHPSTALWPSARQHCLTNSSYRAILLHMSLSSNMSREHVLKRVSRALSLTQHESQCPA
jgi:hypothetical protein